MPGRWSLQQLFRIYDEVGPVITPAEDAIAARLTLLSCEEIQGD